jgi:hypothetical protein
MDHYQLRECADRQGTPAIQDLGKSDCCIEDLRSRWTPMLMSWNFFPFHIHTLLMPDKYYEERLEDMERMRFALDQETGAQRMKRKFREEPFVPAGQPDT